MYIYSTGGRPFKKRMQLQRTDPLGGSGNGAPITGKANLDAEYTWSAEGTLLTLKYPDLRTGHPNQQLAEKGNTITYQTDWLRRYSGMTETSPLNPGNPTTLVSGMQYGISSELTSMTYHTGGVTPVTETRQFNTLGQLTQITAMQGATTITNLQYVFPAGANNGRISSMVNVQSGETVTYTYDELNRLTRAQSPGIPGNPPSAWDEQYAFDGFGNLTQKGSPSIGVLAASNRLTGPGVSYDSNGNQTGMQVGTTNVTNSFDIENRLLEVSGQGFRYGFGPDSRKIWTRNASNGNEDYVFWGPQGKPIGTCRAAWEWTASSGTLWFNAVVSTRRWMGGKEISASSVLIHDRLPSVVGVSAGGAVSRYRYLPYGEPNTAGGSQQPDSGSREGGGAGSAISEVTTDVCAREPGMPCAGTTLTPEDLAKMLNTMAGLLPSLINVSLEPATIMVLDTAPSPPPGPRFDVLAMPNPFAAFAVGPPLGAVVSLQLTVMPSNVGSERPSFALGIAPYIGTAGPSAGVIFASGPRGTTVDQRLGGFGLGFEGIGRFIGVNGGLSSDLQSGYLGPAAGTPGLTFSHGCAFLFGPWYVVQQIR